MGINCNEFLSLSLSLLQCNGNSNQPFVPSKLRGRLGNNTICGDAVHPSLNRREHLSVHNHYGTQHALAFIRQQESSSPDRLLYLNEASALGNLGKAGYPGDELSADWVSMQVALTQVNTHNLWLQRILCNYCECCVCVYYDDDPKWRLLSIHSAKQSNVGLFPWFWIPRFICCQLHEWKLPGRFQTIFCTTKSCAFQREGKE